MDDKTILAIVGTVCTAMGGLFKYMLDHRKTAEGIARDEKDKIITYLQGEITRKDAERAVVAGERDRYLSELLKDRDLMHEAKDVIATMAASQKESRS